MPVKIERNIPMPPKYNGKYPWKALKVGECFRVIGSNARSLVIRANQTYAPKRFEARMTDGIQRVWRTA